MGGKKVNGSAIGKFSRRMIGSLLGIRMSKINLSCSHLVNNKSATTAGTSTDTIQINMLYTLEFLSII
jgi:hypothetical protein